MDQSNKDYKYWLAFAKTDGVGSISLLEIYNHFGSMQEAWNSSHSDWLHFDRLRQKTIENFLDRRKSVNPDKLPEEIEKKDIKTISIIDDNYPAILKEIHDPPALLFVKGDLSICNLERTLAVVGSRKCSLYINGVLKKIISEMANTDVTIVSGMASGVDTFAHQAALDTNLKTIAVIGSGFDFIYPAKNKRLFNNIIEQNGAVLSEYYPDKTPEAWRFPKRNRIVSGLSKGTLVAEAGLKSGALITARLTAEQNRELMCIPGMISNPNTEGTHKLLKEGAALVTTFNDILDCLNWQYISNTAFSCQEPELQLLDNEAKIYEILKLEPKSIDKIVNESHLDIGNIMVTLTALELKGMIKQLPGENYVKA